MPSTIALFSSARRHGNTGRLIDRITSELKIEIVDLTNLRISPFDYDHRNRDDDFEPVMQHVLAHDQIIFASPIYWYAGRCTDEDISRPNLRFPGAARPSAPKAAACGGRPATWSAPRPAQKQRPSS
jgi:hypothetical protein